LPYAFAKVNPVKVYPRKFLPLKYYVSPTAGKIPINIQKII